MLTPNVGGEVPEAIDIDDDTMEASTISSGGRQVKLDDAGQVLPEIIESAGVGEMGRGRKPPQLRDSDRW